MGFTPHMPVRVKDPVEPLTNRCTTPFTIPLDLTNLCSSGVISRISGPVFRSAVMVWQTVLNSDIAFKSYDE
jgi:hypothetical protein